MKWIFPWLLLGLFPVFGQTTVSEVLAEGLKKVAATKTDIAQDDQKALVAATAALLVKHIYFRPDGTMSAFYINGARRSVEWKKMVVSDITIQSVTEADKLNGISKKYSVIISCDAHRAWDLKTNRWGEWQSHGFPDFPLGIVFEYKSGTWTAETPALLKFFSPGAGPSISDSKRKPAEKSDGLPPGMQKLK